jgi:molecular chaperone DnaK
MSLTRTQFEKLTEHLFERCRGPVLKALKDAGLEPRDIDEVVMVGGMTRMPKIQWLVKNIFGKEGHRGVNPDEVVAIGAAIQGAQLLLGSKSDVLLVDVMPLSLGIETLGGRLTKLIERNTSIPTEKKQIFSTAADNQTAVTITVMQGESELARDSANRLLGEFNLEGIRPAPRGEPRIEVEFSLDANGILTVKAKDLDTGKENKIEIKGSSGLDTAEVERMRKEAEAHAEEDRKRVELINARNEAESVVYRVEKELKTHEDKMSEGDKTAIRAAIEKVKQSASKEDVGAIKQASSDLVAASQALARHMQGQAGGGTPGGDDQGGAKGGPSDVEDAEFEVKK